PARKPHGDDLPELSGTAARTESEAARDSRSTPTDERECWRECEPERPRPGIAQADKRWLVRQRPNSGVRTAMMHGFSNAKVWTLALIASTVTVSVSAQQPAAPQQRAVVDQSVVGQAVPEPLPGTTMMNLTLEQAMQMA